jgi:hypothetical protein
MKIRAVGTGSPYCKHPLTKSSFLLQTETSNVVIGCGPGVPAKLESINVPVSKIDMWIILSAKPDQVIGLWEVAAIPKASKPFLVAAEPVLNLVKDFYCNTLAESLDSAFETRATTRVVINDEHSSETVRLIPAYLGNLPSYSALLEEAEILITGDTSLNDEFLHRWGSGSQIILHSCSLPNEPVVGPKNASLDELQTLPLYLQKKIWLYGYGISYVDEIDPLPMMFLPQGTCVYDSDRKEKYLDKERFIRESTKRVAGNQG